MGNRNHEKQSSPADPLPTGEESPSDASKDQPSAIEEHIEEMESAEQSRAEGEEAVEQASAPSEGLTAEVESTEQASEEVEPVAEATPEGINEADIEAVLRMKLPKDSGKAMRKLAAALIEARKERDEEVDKWKRVAAEYDNSRKRLEGERDRAMERASEGVMRELITILDAWDSALAIEISTTTEQKMHEGIEQIRQMVLRVLQKAELTLMEVEPGMPFDPEVHEAVLGSGDVVKAELRPGYRYRSGKVLRHSMVEVGVDSSVAEEGDTESLAEDASQSDAADVGDGAVAQPDNPVSVEAEDGDGPEEGETPVDKD